jgi:hypothetical protein
MAKWIWYGDPIYRYRDEKGRFAATSTIQEWSKISMQAAAANMRPLATDLAEQSLSLGSWQKTMRANIKTQFTQQYLLGIGGRNQMTPSDWGSLGGLLAKQYNYLDLFASQIANGELSENQIGARSEMYMLAARSAFERASAKVRGIPLDAIPVFPTEDCLGLTNCGCNWVYNRHGDEWHATWTLGDTDHCDVCISHASQWNPLII